MQRFIVTIYRTEHTYRWRMKATNGRIIGASTEAYTHRRDMLANLRSVTGFILEPVHVKLGKMRSQRFDFTAGARLGVGLEIRRHAA